MATSIVTISGAQQGTRRILGALRHAGYAVTDSTEVDSSADAQTVGWAALVCLVETERAVPSGPAPPTASPGPPPQVATAAPQGAALEPPGRGPSSGETIEIGRLGIDLAGSEVRVAGRPIKLRTKEFGVLVALVRAAGGILTRQELQQRVWGYPCPIASRTVDVHITWLRGKLAGGAVRIEGVRGLGYRLLPVAEGLASSPAPAAGHTVG